jgi:hypothetical protein
MEVKGLTAGALEAVGGSRWQKNGMDRVYFNDLARWYGLEVELYNSGNVRSARLRGEPISNSEARRIMSRFLNAKLWWDVQSGRWEARGLDDADRDYIVSAILAEVERR